MKKLTFVAVIIAVLAVFLAGCQDSGTQDTSTTTFKSAFKGGVEGLSIKLLDGAPPESVFDKDNKFDVSVLVENKGEYDVPAGKAKFTITGIDPSDFGKTQAELTKTNEDILEGLELVEDKVIPGSIEAIDFPDFAYKDKISGAVTFIFRANVCYDYETISQAQLCIREDLLGTTGVQGTCNPQSFKMNAANSGGPVAVDLLEQQVTGSNKITFTFLIKHVGVKENRISQKGTSCNPSHQTSNKVWVEVDDPGIGKLKCSGLSDGTATSGYATLYEGQRNVRCTLDVNDADLADYLKVIQIKMKYDYNQYTDKEVTVKHAAD